MSPASGIERRTDSMKSRIASAVYQVIIRRANTRFGLLVKRFVRPQTIVTIKETLRGISEQGRPATEPTAANGEIAAHSEPRKPAPEPIATNREIAGHSERPPLFHKLRYTSDIGEQEFNRRCSRQDWWYHSYYFDNGFQVRGDYDVGADVEGYGFPKNMSGMKVLDIGTASGWYAFFFEQQGADVTTVDLRGMCDLDLYGRHSYPPLSSEKVAPDRFDRNGGPIYDSIVSAGFWIMKEILGSRVCFKNASAYDLSPDLFGGAQFDLVFMGAVLLHLRDPISALMGARRVCRGQIIATTSVVDGEPEATTPPRQYLPWTAYSQVCWWHPNEACFRHWFLAAGFRDVDIERRALLRCDKENRDDQGRLINPDQILRVGKAFV